MTVDIKEILIVTFAITTVISSIGWAVNFNSTKALLMYMCEQGVELPDKGKIGAYCKRAAKHTLGIKMENVD